MRYWGNCAFYNSANEDFTEFGVLLEDCRFLLGRNPNISLISFKRQINLIAYCLAREYRNYINPFYWECAPSFIINFDYWFSLIKIFIWIEKNQR